MANEIVQGDNGTVLALKIQDNGQIVDLTDTTVSVVITYKSTGVNKQASITDAVNGLCEVILSSQDILYEGIYAFQATVSYSIDDRKFTSTIQRFSVTKKIGFIPSTGGGTGGSTEVVGGLNGHILVNGSDVKVYDDATLKADISTLKTTNTATNNTLNTLNTDVADLKNSKHVHSNISALSQISTDGTNLLFNGSAITFDDTAISNEISTMSAQIGDLSTLNTTSKGSVVDAINSVQLSGGSVPSNVILFEDWVAGETVTIDTSVPSVDTTAPNNVTNLITSNLTATTLTLSWTASTSTDVAGYDIYQGSTLLTTTTSATYNVMGLLEKTQYTFTIKAKDTVGNIASGTSTTVITADVTAPNNVTNLVTSNITATSLTLSWIASTSTDVVSYEVYNGVTLLSTVTGNTYNVSGLVANTGYTFNVKAKDGSNNIASGTSVAVTTSSVADTTAPDNVTNLTTSNVTQSGLTLNWTASVSSDIASYDIYNGVTLLTNVTGTTYNVTSLTASTQYTFYVKAKDVTGNVASGTSVVIATLAPPADTTAPILTITPAATFTDTKTVTMSTNETATIYYTLDDTDPKVSGTKLTYTAPLTLTETDTVKAYAVDTASNASAVQTVTYTKENTTPTEVATNGMILHLDGLDTASITGTGVMGQNATWLDKSGLNNNMTLVIANGTTTSPVVVNDTNLGMPKNNNFSKMQLPFTNFNNYPVTWEFIVNLPTTSSELVRVGHNTSTPNYKMAIRRDITTTSANGRILLTKSGSGGYIEADIPPTHDVSKYAHVVFTVDNTSLKLYLNGVELPSMYNSAFTMPVLDDALVSGVAEYQIARNASQYVKTIRAYDRILIPNEILGNYNAQVALLV